MYICTIEEGIYIFPKLIISITYKDLINCKIKEKIAAQVDKRTAFAVI